MDLGVVGMPTYSHRVVFFKMLPFMSAPVSPCSAPTEELFIKYDTLFLPLLLLSYVY